MNAAAGGAGRPSLLYLCHRIPYPPNKGDKVRSWNWLKRLSVDYRVSLATFVDDDDDWQHEGVLREYCERLCLRPLTTAAKLRRAATGLLRGAALTTSVYEDRHMHRFVREVVADGGADRVLLFSSGMLPYVAHCEPRRVLLDFVDVDSVKWGQYAQTARQPMRFVYAREAVRLREAEADAAREACATTLISAPEASLFEDQLAQAGGRAGARVEIVGNGVDTAYFDRANLPSADPLPLPAEAPLVVFTGAMDYPPNADAAAWFVRASWPAVRERVPGAQFAVVGARPTEAVRELARVDGVTVTGTVPDVRPWLAGARAAVAPLRVARGIQNKILEAMAMELAVVSTEAAAEGIAPGHDVVVCRPPDNADTGGDDEALAASIADAVVDLLTRAPDEREAAARRAFVLAHYDWDAAANRLRELLGDQPVLTLNQSPTSTGSH